MRYVAGVDGGGSKTRMVICDERGKVFADVCGGSTNHQMIGQEEVEGVLRYIYKRALKMAGLQETDITLIYLGLAGADMKSDFILLAEVLKKVFGETRTILANDTWPILRSGTPGKWGATVICGTGTNAAAVSPTGEKQILRALGYALGGAGGGFEMAMSALHWAFRADEKTAEKSALTERLPEILGLSSMEKLMERMYPEFLLQDKDLAMITPLIFELANEGDRICQDILLKSGTELGEMLGSLLRKTGMDKLAAPVVLGGSVMGGANPLMRDQLMTTIHRFAPKAEFLFPRIAPVGGAVLLALEDLGIETEPEIHDHFAETLSL